MATKNEIPNLLKEARRPLEENVDSLNLYLAELTKTVEFLSSKFGSLLSQIKQTNEKVQNQGTCLSRTQKYFDEERKDTRAAQACVENLSKLLRRGSLEIMAVPFSVCFLLGERARAEAKIWRSFFQ